MPEDLLNHICLTFFGGGKQYSYQFKTIPNPHAAFWESDLRESPF
jgi:hypothetical protein